MKSLIMKKQTGLTIVEMTMVIVIIGILAASLAPIIGAAADAWQFTSFRKEIVSDARIAMSRMIREIRQIENPSTYGAATITTMSLHAFEFIDVHGDSIRYEQSGTNLLRNGQVLAIDLEPAVWLTDGLFFLYLTGNNIPTFNPLDVRTIIVQITFNNEAGEFSIQNKVWPRNL